MSQQSSRIVHDDDIRAGKPTIEGTRITVRRVQALVEDRNLPPEEVAVKFDLDVEDVQAAIDYYEANPDEMEELERQAEANRRQAIDAGANILDDFRPDDE
jgi:uncharacterized protein (DUF433 family)